MMQITDRYVPALRYRILTPLYDPLWRLAMRKDNYVRRLIEQAQVEPGMRILDIGCGTATLAMLIKQLHPQAQVTGLDGDPAILEIASKKVSQAGLDISLDQGMAFELPYPEGSFDRVLSSMVMHHLSRENKHRSMQEIYRVLRAQGEFHMVDFGVPDNYYARMTSLVLRNFEDVADNFKGKLIAYIRSSGFTNVQPMGVSNTFFGTLTFYKAIK